MHNFLCQNVRIFPLYTYIYIYIYIYIYAYRKNQESTHFGLRLLPKFWSGGIETFCLPKIAQEKIGKDF